MKLVFLSGPPASGKLTIAQELSKIINFKVYHNHLAHDLVESIFDHESHRPLIAEINLFILSRAIKERVSGIIITSCYTHPEDDKFVGNVGNLIKEDNGEINFVSITCSKNELFRRVKEESRNKYGKIKDEKQLEDLLKRKDFFTRPSTDSFVIDNTNIPAPEVAMKIRKYFHL